jgi:hypothetical protein
VTTIYQGSCARCDRRVRTHEDHLKAHLWAGTAVFHWSCFIALMKEHPKEPAEGAKGKELELCESEKQRQGVQAAIPGTERNRR